MLPPAGSRPGEPGRTFRLRSSDGFVEAVGPALLARLAVEAPGAAALSGQTRQGGGPLRRGELDFETGVIGATTALSCAPRPCSRTTSSPWCTRTTPLRRHPDRGALCRRAPRAGLRRGQPHSPIDEILAGQGKDAPSPPWYPGLRRRWPWSGRAIWWRRCCTCTAPACSAIWSPCPALRSARDPGRPALAPQSGCRSGPPLAARPDTGHLCPAPYHTGTTDTP